MELSPEEIAKKAAEAAFKAALPPPGPKLAARITDLHLCPLVDGIKPHVGGPVIEGCPTVLICGSPAARIGDKATCVGPPDVIATGSPTVLIGGKFAARFMDQTVHGGMITSGAPTVIIGDMGMGSAGSSAVMVSAKSKPGAKSGTTVPKSMSATKLSQSNPKLDKLPKQMRLSKAALKDMRKLWKKSITKSGKSKEQGGTLALDPDGKLVMINKSSGSSGAFSPNTDVPDGYTYVGTFHTHPYGKNDGTWNGATMPFSAGDISSIDDYNEKISVVQSGDNVYALVPTDKTPSNIPDKATEKAYDQSFNKEYAKQKKAGKTDAEAASLAGEKATADMAKKYNMGYYKGKNGQPLERINP